MNELIIDKAFAVSAKTGDTGARIIIVRAVNPDGDGRKTYTAAEAITAGIGNTAEGFAAALKACDGVFGAKAARRCAYVLAKLQAAICADRFGSDDERTVDAEIRAAEKKDAYDRELTSRLAATKAKERAIVSAGKEAYIAKRTDAAAAAFDRKADRVSRWDAADAKAAKAAKAEAAK